MSALALVARRRGVSVTGCDPDPSGAADVAALGADVFTGHDPKHVEGARAVVVTAAVAPDHPELARAHALGVPVVPRKKALADLVRAGTVVGISGTHGKSTTTVMTTEALTAAGLAPTGIAGGRVNEWGGNAKPGGDRLFVVESDEYDQAFLALTPSVAVVNNVEADHLECYGSLEALERAFVTFAGRAGRILLGADHRDAELACRNRQLPAALEHAVGFVDGRQQARLRIDDEQHGTVGLAQQRHGGSLIGRRERRDCRLGRGEPFIESISAGDLPQQRLRSRSE